MFDFNILSGIDFFSTNAFLMFEKNQAISSKITKILTLLLVFIAFYETNEVVFAFLKYQLYSYKDMMVF